MKNSASNSVKTALFQISSRYYAETFLLTSQTVASLGVEKFLQARIIRRWNQNDV